MYANMKPRQAAAALTTVDEEVAVKILTGMKSKQSGEILSYMDPRHAAQALRSPGKDADVTARDAGYSPQLLFSLPSGRRRQELPRVDTRQKEQNLNTTKL